jgi:hypothetical protein
MLTAATPSTLRFNQRLDEGVSLFRSSNSR